MGYHSHVIWHVAAENSGWQARLRGKEEAMVQMQAISYLLIMRLIQLLLNVCM